MREAMSRGGGPAVAHLQRDNPLLVLADEALRPLVHLRPPRLRRRRRRKRCTVGPRPGCAPRAAAARAAARAVAEEDYVQRAAEGGQRLEQQVLARVSVGVRVLG